MKASLRPTLAMLILGITTPVMADDINLTEAETLRQAGKVKSDAELQAIALGLHPGATIRETELEHEYNRYEYKVELRDTQGKDWELEIDASNGIVYENERDD